MSEHELNIDLLKKVRDKIATTPGAYNQETWAKPSASAPCGTAACIAGWACIISGAIDVKQLYSLAEGRQWVAIEGAAQAQLGLTRAEADTLFSGDPSYDWPIEFGDQWDSAYGDNKQEAEIAVEYLDSIINTGEVL